jgi:hypothetical protein
VVKGILSRKNDPVYHFNKNIRPMNCKQHHITELFKQYAGLQQNLLSRSDTAKQHAANRFFKQILGRFHRKTDVSILLRALPDHWFGFLAGETVENQQLCPFLFQYFGKPHFFCVIHNIKPISCRSFDRKDCRRHLEDRGLHGNGGFKYGFLTNLTCPFASRTQYSL